MTKKDYILIAGNIADVRLWAEQADDIAVKAVDAVAERLALALKTDNPHFDRARFLKACGTQPVS